jgi:hypothetical protein
MREDGMDAHLHLRLIRVVLDFAALHLGRLDDGHLLEEIVRRAMRHPVPEQQIFASGRSRPQRRKHERPAPHHAEYPLHPLILSRGAQREPPGSDDFGRLYKGLRRLPPPSALSGALVGFGCGEKPFYRRSSSSRR